MSRATKIFSGTTVPEPTKTNRDGYPAYERSLEEQYLQTLLTNTFGSTFYATQKELTKEAEALHKQMVKANPEFMAKAIPYARTHGYMRTQPIYGLAVLAGARKPYFEQAFSSTILTPNDLNDFITILKNVRGNEGGRRIKRVVGNWLLNNLNEYWVIKYGAEKKEGYSLSDLLRITHPIGEKSAIVDYILEKETDISHYKQLEAFEALKKAVTDEDKVKYITEGRLPHEVATVFAGSSKTVWNAIVPNLPIFALLKNLATLERHGVLDENKTLIAGKFSNKDIISKSKILPFRFLEAVEHVRSAWAKDSLRGALELSFANLPEIQGNTSVLLDISGSMHGDFIQIASIFAIALMKKTDLSGKFITFNTHPNEVAVSKHDSILTQASRIYSMGGTDTACGIEKLTAEKFKTDNIILITDEQQNTGSTFISALYEYRKKVNDNVKVFVIDVSPYRSAVVPLKERNCFYIFGWSDRVLDYIAFTTQGFNTLVEYVNAF